MPDRSATSTRGWIVAAVAILAVLAATAGAVDLRSASTARTAGGGATGQLGTTCDFAEVYEGTIDSVVLVTSAGGQGSGFVYRTDAGNGTGYVVTNAHVVGDADSVTVRFREGEFGNGTVVGRDAYADLAVVRVEESPGYAEALPVAESVPAPGRGVAALGSPFGLRGTVTHGIVSGVNRSMPTDRGYSVPDVIQTDAPINPGNSGGPLLTCDGAVVGVNTAGVSAALGDNVGFAISAPLIRRVVPELLDDGDVAWPYLGIRSTDVTPAIARANGLEVARGVAVVETVGGGPVAGVLQSSEEVRSVEGRPVPVGGDVIVAIDGRPVATGEDLSSYLAREAAPGEITSLTVVRDGQRQRVNVTLGERPRSATAPGG